MKQRKISGQENTAKIQSFLIGFFSGSIFSFLVGFWISSLHQGPELKSEKQEKISNQADNSGNYEDFWEMFPETEVSVDNYPGTPSKSASNPMQWVIQAGSFSKSDEADKRRARLILLGLGAKIQKVVIRDEEKYRVLSGPLNSRNELEKTREVLRREGIGIMVSQVPSE